MKDVPCDFMGYGISKKLNDMHLFMNLLICAVECWILNHKTEVNWVLRNLVLGGVYGWLGGIWYEVKWETIEIKEVIG